MKNNIKHTDSNIKNSETIRNDQYGRNIVKHIYHLPFKLINGIFGPKLASKIIGDTNDRKINETIYD